MSTLEAELLQAATRAEVRAQETTLKVSGVRWTYLRKVHADEAAALRARAARVREVERRLRGHWLPPELAEVIHLLTGPLNPDSAGGTGGCKTPALLVFACGAFYEASCVGFVHFAEAGGAWKTALMSALAGLAEVTGIFGTVKDWHVGPFFVAGLGVGAFLGVKLKEKR